MCLQKRVLSIFLDSFKEKPSNKELAGILEINETRVYRILRNSPMKLYEYEKILSYLLAHKQEIGKSEGTHESLSLQILMKDYEGRVSQKIRNALKESLLREIKFTKFFD